MVHADAWRAHGDASRRADPLGHRPGRGRRRLDPGGETGRAGVRDRQDRRDTADPGYLLTVADLAQWEADHGPIPPNAWVLFRTGWGIRAQDEAAFLNVGENGPQTPGPDVEASRWLASAEREISGFGTETVGIDAGAAGGFDPPFPLHNLLLGAGRCGLTQLANLDRLPATGALLVVAPLKLVGGTGSPSRVLAFVPRG